MSNHHLSIVRKMDIKGPARAVLMVLADRANDDGKCWPGMSKIGKESGYCRSTIKNALASLKTTELISWIQRRDDDGNLTSNIYTLTLPRAGDDLPRAGDDLPRAGDGLGVGQEIPYPRAGDGHKASMEASSGSINEASLFCEGDLPIAQKPSSKKRDQQPMAETIYHAYPRKEDKRAGIKAIVTAMKKHDPAFLLEKTKAYAAAIGWKEKNFIPFPATWFNKERFNDDPETWEQSPKYTSSPNKPKAASVNMGGRKSEYF